MRTILFALPLAIAFAAPAAASPETCAAAPAALKSAAVQAPADVQRRALRDVAVGEKLCDAGNRFEATRKFRDAARTLNTDLATLLNAGTATAEAAQ